MFSLTPLKIPANERKAVTRLNLLKSFAEQYSTLRKVLLPKEYHMGHTMFNRNTEVDPYGENDLDLYESIHNGKKYYIISFNYSLGGVSVVGKQVRD